MESHSRKYYVDIVTEKNDWKGWTPRLEQMTACSDKNLKGRMMGKLRENSIYKKEFTAEYIAQRYNIQKTPYAQVVKDVEAEEFIPFGWIPAREKSNNQQLIPKIIYQTWKTNNLHSSLAKKIIKWSEMNPEYDYLFFDDEQINAFIKIEYGNEIYREYKKIQIGAAKADVWRLLMVYKYGGLYVDVDVAVQRPLRDIGLDGFQSVEQLHRPEQGQWVLFYSPCHPLLHHSISLMFNSLINKIGNFTIYVAFVPYNWALHMFYTCNEDVEELNKQKFVNISSFFSHHCNGIWSFAPEAAKIHGGEQKHWSSEDITKGVWVDGGAQALCVRKLHKKMKMFID